VCQEYFLNHKHLRNHIVRTCEIQDTEEGSSKLLPLTLRGSPPRGFYRCPLYTFFTDNRFLFAKRFMFHHEPKLPDTPAPVENVHFVEKTECSICHRLIATTHVKHNH
jgi:hypothetical protein